MTKALAINNEFRMKLGYLMLGACFAVILFYAFNVYKAVTRTVALQKIQTQMTEMSSELAGLDSKYLEISSKISAERLSAYGLKEGQPTAFISRTKSLGRVALSGYEL